MRSLRCWVGPLLLCCTLQSGSLLALDSATLEGAADSTAQATPASDAIFEDGAALGRILSFDRLGNVRTSFVASDLERLGLAVGDRIEIASGDRKVEAHLGESVFEARLGEWVAFVSLEGRLIISRSYGRAVTGLRTDVDEPIEIRAAKVPASDGR